MLNWRTTQPRRPRSVGATRKSTSGSLSRLLLRWQAAQVSWPNFHALRCRLWVSADVVRAIVGLR